MDMAEEKFCKSNIIISFPSHDMVVQILSRLPAKTLMRFKCISKCWYALIISPELVNMHLSNSINSSIGSMHNNNNNSNTCCFILNRLEHHEDPEMYPHQTLWRSLTETAISLLRFRKNNSDHNMSNGDDDDDGSTRSNFSCVVEDITVPPSMETSLKANVAEESLRIVGVCDGIVCLTNNPGFHWLGKPSEVCLWNPATREFKLVPHETYIPENFNLEVDLDWNVASNVPLWVYSTDKFMNALGFGYDPKSKDYKLVNIGFSGTEPGANELECIIYPPKAVVYTLATDVWKEIKTDGLETEDTIFWPLVFKLYFKGMYYWFGKEQKKYYHEYQRDDGDEFWAEVLVLFDTSDEVFHSIWLPQEYIFDCGWDKPFVGLSVWNDSIALFGRFNIGLDEPCELWVMDHEFNVANPKCMGASPWTKILKLVFNDAVPWAFDALTFWCSDELLVKDRYGQLKSYNISTKEIVDLRLRALPDDSRANLVHIYVESIVSVAGDNQFET